MESVSDTKQTAIPDEELAVFNRLDIRGVVVDVGAREDIDMYLARPECEYHLFEPSVEFFKTLEDKTRGIPNIHINNYGLSNEQGEGIYNVQKQSFLNYPGTGHGQRLDTLDTYCEEKGIEAIDFLKIDTEGYDLRVLVGGAKILEKTRFIQFEYWDGVVKFHDMLSEDFHMFLMMEPVLRGAVYEGFNNQEVAVDMFKNQLIPLEDWLIELIEKAFIPNGHGGNILCIRK